MFMERTLPSRKRGTHLLTNEKMELTFSIVDLLLEGMETEAGLAKKLHVNRTTIRRYKPYALDIIGRAKHDRNAVRNRQIARTNLMIEKLSDDLKKAQNVKEKSLIYSSLAKYYHHLALVAGLLYDKQTQQTDPQKLVIIRPAKATQ